MGPSPTNPLKGDIMTKKKDQTSPTCGNCGHSQDCHEIGVGQCHSHEVVDVNQVCRCSQFNTEGPFNPRTEDAYPLLQVKVGLRQQGHVPTIKKMLSEDKSWKEIGEAINWDPETAKQHWEWLKDIRIP